MTQFACKVGKLCIFSHTSPQRKIQTFLRTNFEVQRGNLQRLLFAQTVQTRRRVRLVGFFFQVCVLSLLLVLLFGVLMYFGWILQVSKKNLKACTAVCLFETARVSTFDLYSNSSRVFFFFSFSDWKNVEILRIFEPWGSNSFSFKVQLQVQLQFSKFLK